MNVTDMVISERWNYASLAMGKEKKTAVNYRFGSLAMKVIHAELAERSKNLPPKAKKPTETSIVEEAILITAAKDPKRKALLMEEIRKDPEYSFLLRLLSEDSNNANG